MDIGDLNRRITITRPQTVKDPLYGTEVVTWVALATRISANLQDTLPSKTESAATGVRMNTQPTRVRIRYRPDITSDMRVILHTATDRTCQIIAGPAEMGRRKWLEFVVVEYSTK